MTVFTYLPANDQSEPGENAQRFPVQQFLAGIPQPTTAKDNAYGVRIQDPAFHWVEIPHVFPFDSSIYNLRRRFPGYQFEKAGGGTVTTGKYAGHQGRRIRTRRNPHL